MARTIKVDPERLEGAAQKIEAQAADYQRLYRQLYSEVQGMGAAWQGRDNKVFVEQIQGFEDDFIGMWKLMDDFSIFLRRSAEKYRNTQEDTVNEARRLAN